MIATPAVDLRGGRCVQLVGGRPDAERVSLPDPLAVAERWGTVGFGTLHVVDLDAALGSGDNTELVGRIVRSVRTEVQVGGGIREDARVDALLGEGVARVVIGTRALDDVPWLASIAERWPGRVVAALDTREGKVLRKGWTESTSRDVVSYLDQIEDLPLAGVLSTDVGREGRLGGIDRDSCARVIEATDHRVCISGGVTTIEELEFLEEVGAAEVVLGMAIYTETLDTSGVARRWGGRHG